VLKHILHPIHVRLSTEFSDLEADCSDLQSTGSKPLPTPRVRAGLFINLVTDSSVGACEQIITLTPLTEDIKHINIRNSHRCISVWWCYDLCIILTIITT